MIEVIEYGLASALVVAAYFIVARIRYRRSLAANVDRRIAMLAMR